MNIKLDMPDTAQHLLLSEAIEKNNSLSLVITSSAQEANSLTSVLNFFLKDTNVPILSFPDRETLPYDVFSPHQDLISKRLETLSKLSNISRGALIVPITTLMNYLPPKEFISSRTFIYKVGDNFDSNELQQRLSASGYRRVQTVYEHGEFALRGSIIDIYPMGVANPFRIDLFDDEIESIRIFETTTQVSTCQVENINLIPANEFPLDKPAIDIFSSNWVKYLDSDPLKSNIYKSVRKGISPNGIEYYMPLFFLKTSTLFDYLPQNLSHIVIGDIENLATKYWNDISLRYENCMFDTSKPPLKPEKLFSYPKDIIDKITATRRLDNADIKCSSSLYGVLPCFENTENLEQKLSSLETFLSHERVASPTLKVLFCVESSGRREILIEMLQTINIFPKEVNSWKEFKASNNHFSITISELMKGVYLTDKKELVLTESDLFGQKVQQRRRRKVNNESNHNFFRDLSELKIEEPVVHLEHGIGLYKGLETLIIDNVESEFIVLMYAEKSIIYLPVSSIHLISRFSSGTNIVPKLNRLGSDQWDTARKKAVAKARDTAVELLDVYSRRASSIGFSYRPFEVEYQQFCSEFKFEETADQLQAIDAVRNDLLDKKLMDRLICGDVGFGKTEVAMRAAFTAMVNAKQVVILVPTTLLAQQHLTTFRDRFSEWPFQIEELSRFKSATEQKAIIKQVEAGKVDLLISTHKLLYQNLKFKNLSLMVIDEEHRFGVRQKEKMKSLKSNIDILTMTATPIPRTLNLAMNEVRDLSIIATPPEKRLSVKTFVTSNQTAIIREAISREILRGGQVYFLHNDVKTITRITQNIKELVPEATVDFAHGQMRERDLERVMSDFYHQRFAVLVCTTIIETGIDIPSANTIVINNADKFGLAQLHQLRGRVGRSHHQAYAYLVTDEDKKITSDAKKRLEAISISEKLGSGFILATNDLEIRGAGELLGDEQSGHIHTIGFTLYMEMLERAITELREGSLNYDTPLIADQTEINLHVPTYIPETYIVDVNTRLMMYKRIANCKKEEEMHELQVEMIDRFGLLPTETKNLFSTNHLKQLAHELGITKLEFSKTRGRIKFSDKTNIKPENVIKLIQNEPDKFQLKSQNQLNFVMEIEQDDDLFKKISDILVQINCNELDIAQG